MDYTEVRETLEGRLDQVDVEISERADALSEMLRPSKWRVVEYWFWKRHRQPGDLVEAFTAAYRGDYAPLKRAGFSFRRPTDG